MCTVYVISDLHFGHDNLAIHRGFKNAHHQDEYIVKSWNNVVSKRDLTYILGDITLEKANYGILDRLNGRKIVVGGNHDKPQHSKKLMEYVEGIAGMVNYKGHVLTHCPIHLHELKKRFNSNIHGHIHDKPLITELSHKYTNVCAEVLCYVPIEINQIMDTAKHIMPDFSSPFCDSYYTIAEVNRLKHFNKHILSLQKYLNDSN